MVARAWAAVVLCVVSFAGCGGDDKGSSSTGVSAESCNRQCDAQSKVTGCTPLVPLADCKQLCGALAGGTPAACAGQFDAYYDCSANAGFECAGSLVTQKGGACSAEMKAFRDCQTGGKKPVCQGADDGGFCPSVTCPCPSGATPISGFDNTSGSCKCLDTTTCLDLC